MSINRFFILALSVGIMNNWAPIPAAAKDADPPLPAEGIVDPMNDLRRSSSKFIDSTELELVIHELRFLKNSSAASRSSGS